MAENQLTADDQQLRGSIATKVLKYGILTIGILAAIIIVTTLLVILFAKADFEKSIALIVNIFNALLPVIAAWVGTVIAFYFGKENFEAASKSVQEMARQVINSDDKLKATMVSDKDVMRLFNKISYNKDIADKEDKDINVEKDLLDFIEANQNGDRLPIFTSKNIIRYIIHESTLNEFVRKLSCDKYPDLKDKKLSEITLDMMISKTDDEMKNKLTRGLSFVSKNASLFDANEKIKLNKWSLDVFVTETGAVTEPVIGWITNNKITDFVKI